jgi:uncharacterized protein
MWGSLPPDLFTYLTYGSLYLTVISLWLPFKTKIPVWSLLLVIAVIFGFISHQLEWIALFPIFVLLLALYFTEMKQVKLWVRITAGIIALVVAVLLSTHQFPGFGKVSVINNAYISKDAIPFSLSLGFDKLLVGIFILGITLPLIKKGKEWLILFKQMIPRAIVVIIIILVLAYLLNFVHFDPKLPKNLFIWSLTNLLFVCLAEEGLFRGFIQKNLTLLLRNFKYGTYIAIFIAAWLFGLAHFPGGIKYIFLATIAGCGYGWVYDRTKHIEGSMLTHFTLNLTHFVLFTYPMLKTAL